jgi:hypothetical protein
MAIVFACPVCNFVMKAPEDKGGIKIKCIQCSVSMEIPYLRGILVNVPAEQASPVFFGTSTIKPGSSHGSSHGSAHGSSHGSAHGISSAPPKETRVDGWLKEAAALKDKDDFDGAIQILKRAYEEVKRENLLLSVDAFLRLPVYLQQSGKMKEAWAEFNNLLFKGYPNQPKDQALLATDRSKIFDKMRIFLEREGRLDIAAVYNVFGHLCKGIALHKENRNRELRSWLSKGVCSDYIEQLKKYPGNLGAVQPVREAIMEELGRFPDVDFEKLGSRVDAALAAK